MPHVTPLIETMVAGLVLVEDFVMVFALVMIPAIVEQARAINPGLHIIARAHSDAEVDYLKARGTNLAIMDEREIARRIIDQALVGT